MTLSQLNNLKLSEEVILTKDIKYLNLIKGDILIYIEYHKEMNLYNFLSVDKGSPNILHLTKSIHRYIEDKKIHQRLENLKSLGL